MIAADYIRNLRQETIKGLNGRLKQGLWPFAAPIGYLNNGKGQVKTIDPINGPLVRKLFELYTTGEYSYISLIPMAQESGIKNISGRPITKTCIEKTLRNPFYLGLMHIKRRNETYQGIHKPLVSTELFERCQEVRLGRQIKTTTKHNFTYRGVFRCGYCSRTMTAERQKGHVYYRCHTRDCITKSVREDEIELQLVSELNLCSITEEAVSELQAYFKPSVIQTNERSKRDALQLELGRVDQKMTNLTDALIDKLVDKETFENRKFELLKRSTKLREELKNHNSNRDISKYLSRMFELLKNVGDTYLFLDPSEKRQLVKILTSNRRLFAKKLYTEHETGFRYPMRSLPTSIVPKVLRTFERGLTCEICISNVLERCSSVRSFMSF